MNGTTTSLMQPSLGSKTDLSAFDLLAAVLHYARGPKNTSYDVDNSTSYQGNLVPAAAPIMTEWICSAEPTSGTADD